VLNNNNNNTNCHTGILSEDEWGDLECPNKACQADITDGGLFPDTGVHERGQINDRVKITVR